MSSTSTSSAGPAPWRRSFLSTIESMSSPEFVLATVHPSSSNTFPNDPASTRANAIQAPVSYEPRARYCIYRGMWGELPPNDHNQAPKNPRVYESDLPTFTTDTRMLKVQELFATSAGHAEEEGQTRGSGGGGPVEAVWWNGEEMMQWRVKGHAFIVGPDIESGDRGHEGGSSGVRTVKAEVGKRVRVVEKEKEGEWSWEKELDAHFGNLSPVMRGSFKAPPPGTPKDQKYDTSKYSLGEKVNDLHQAAARENFRVVIIRPDEVEYLNLQDMSNAKRMKYTYDPEKGEWKTEEVWP